MDKSIVSSGILIERKRLNEDGAVLGLVTLNRPAELNPIDWTTAKELGDAFDLLAGEPQVRVVAVTGAGRAFSAGGDMKRYQQLQRHRRNFPSFSPVSMRSS